MSVEYVTEMREYTEQLMGSFFTLCTLFLSLPPYPLLLSHSFNAKNHILHIY